jgi:asparagine synthase (glutamine-hydrolysing)
MCGIHLITDSDTNTSAIAIDNMIIASRHRGPDNHSALIEEGIALGFNRLEIVGGESGNQPMITADGSIIAIANGEIFNHEQLKNLQNIQYKYTTTSDMEVILALYQEYGPSFIEKLEGQFSFIIVDKSQSKIILGRDSWGITPLFYKIIGSTLIVSSSIKSILESGFVESAELDPFGIAESWMLYGPTPPRTCFKDIQQLIPGTYAIYDLEKHQLATSSYNTSMPSKISTSESADAAQLYRQLELSIKRRLQGSHGPGVYVSGGVDSSIIASMATSLHTSKPILFGIHFEDTKYDESKYQKMLAEYLGCELQSVNINTKSIVDNIEACVSYTEAPLIRSAPVPMMLLSKKVHQAGLKYVLSGEGADELLAGYPVFSRGVSSVMDKASELSAFSECFRDNQLITKVASTIDYNNDVSLLQLRKQEITTKLSRYLLVTQGDRVSMANSVEQRFPFLDSAVVDLALSLDPSRLIKNGEGKQILREAFKDHLPEQLLNRQKQAYLTPDVDVVERLHKLGLLESLLSKEYCNIVGIFDYGKVTELITHRSQEVVSRFLLFAYSTHLLFKLYTV